MHHFDRSAEIYCEWGEQGIEALRGHVDVFVIVDVLSFSTCVDIVVGRGATVAPYGYKNDSAIAHARSIGALFAKPSRSKTELSLSAYSLLSIESGTKLVLPSPNGSHLSQMTGGLPTYCGSLRNASSVGKAARTAAEKIGVITAGERWTDGSIRFALEDWLGAGAIISAMEGRLTAEADAARRAFQNCEDIADALRQCSSGIELIARGFSEDVELAAGHDVSTAIPLLCDGAYVHQRL